MSVFRNVLKGLAVQPALDPLEATEALLVLPWCKVVALLLRSVIMLTINHFLVLLDPAALFCFWILHSQSVTSCSSCGLDFSCYVCLELHHREEVEIVIMNHFPIK